MKVVYIYTLSCPQTGVIKYVGKTNDLRLRYNQHVSDRRGMTPVKAWIKNLKNACLMPVLDVMDECNIDTWRFWESYWICQIKSWGFHLKNTIDGGIGVGEIPQEMRNKISTTLKGRKPPVLAVQIRSRQVCQYSLLGDYLQSFKSMSSSGFAVSNIISAIKRRQSAYGYQWRYHTPFFSDNIGSYKRNRGISTKRGSYKKSRLAIDKTKLPSNE